MSETDKLAAILIAGVVGNRAGRANAVFLVLVQFEYGGLFGRL